MKNYFSDISTKNRTSIMNIWLLDMYLKLLREKQVVCFRMLYYYCYCVFCYNWPNHWPNNDLYEENRAAGIIRAGVRVVVQLPKLKPDPTQYSVTSKHTVYPWGLQLLAMVILFQLIHQLSKLIPGRGEIGLHKLNFGCHTATTTIIPRFRIH